MSKGLKIFLSILALISISLSISILFGWSPFFLKEESQPAVIEEKPILTPNPIPTDRDWLPELREMEDKDKDALVLPVEEKYLETALESKDNAQVLSFYLDPEASIKAIFNGKIRKIVKDQKPFPEDNDFDEIILDREDEKLYASYVIFGEVLVNEGDIIEAGQEIARAKEGGLGFRSGTNLSLWIHDKEGEFMEINKSLFQKGE
jgi:hypothetical protein